MCPICPTCELPMDPDARRIELGDLVLRPDAREIQFRGKALRLKPSLVGYMAVMMRNAGRASRGELLRISRNPNTDDDKVVDVQICNLRKALKNAGMAGIEIATIPKSEGKGYRLEVFD